MHGEAGAGDGADAALAGRQVAHGHGDDERVIAREQEIDQDDGCAGD